MLLIHVSPSQSIYMIGHTALGTGRDSSDPLPSLHGR